MVISAVSTTGRLATRGRGGRNPGRIVPAISRARFPHIVDARAGRGVQLGESQRSAEVPSRRFLVD